ncbi:MAG: amidohydrolase family protein [Phycisphaerae bacterium]|jgi:hypothetical protein|nr:amidohydrolase family protein [Phycisphaerae bacterium]
MHRFLRLLGVTACLWCSSVVLGQTPGQRTVLRNATLVPLAPASPSSVLPNQAIIIESGKIVDIKSYVEDDLRAGDVLVDAEGRWVLAGFIEAVDPTPERYAALARGPLRGVTTIAARFGAIRKLWLERIAVTASIPLPSLADIGDRELRMVVAPVPGPHAPADEVAEYLIARTSQAADRLGLADRGRIAVGQRADFIILDRDPFVDPASVERPMEAIIGGVPMRRAALETHRNMIADADRAIASWPPATATDYIYEIESSGLRLGQLVIGRDAMKATETWGPPVEQTTTWELLRTSGHPDQWSFRLTETATHGHRISIDLDRTKTDILARAHVVGPDTVPAAEATIAGTPDEPLSDPISLFLRQRHRLGVLEAGGFADIDVVEPVPVIGKVKVGLRVLRCTRLSNADGALPFGSNARLFRIDAAPSREAFGDAGAGNSPPKSTSTLGWVITDQNGLPHRAALVADEGITEYFLSLPQPGRSSEPQSASP